MLTHISAGGLHDRATPGRESRQGGHGHAPHVQAVERETPLARAVGRKRLISLRRGPFPPDGPRARAENELGPLRGIADLHAITRRDRSAQSVEHEHVVLLDGLIVGHVRERQRQHAEVRQVLPVDARVVLRDNDAQSRYRGAMAACSRLDPCPYSFRRRRSAHRTALARLDTSRRSVKTRTRRWPGCSSGTEARFVRPA